MTLTKNDFVEVDFVGKIVATGQVFDSTIEQKKPVVTCIGSGMLLPAVDISLEGKSVGQEYSLDLKPEDAFGQRNPKLMQLVPLQVFKEKGVYPTPGLQVNIDGVLATIRSVSSGRVTIDFNHPLAGKALNFWVKINKQIIDVKEKLTALLKEWEPEIDVKEKEIDIKISKKLPEKAGEIKAAQLKRWIPEIKDKEIKFISKAQSEAKASAVPRDKVASEKKTKEEKKEETAETKGSS
jgi:FKBP-type peptidyl-prolyl cis-trans isomerase SlyD